MMPAFSYQIRSQETRINAIEDSLRIITRALGDARARIKQLEADFASPDVRDSRLASQAQASRSKQLEDACMRSISCNKLL